MGRLQTLYGRLPVLGQHAAVSLYGAYWHWLRFGRGFRRAVREYEARERFSSEQWRLWQRDRLRDLLSLASSEVPYYRRTWSPSEKAAALAGRLGEIPLLEKDPLRAEPEAFLRERGRGRRYSFWTSGSTGTPIASIWTASEMRSALALREARSARWARVSFALPRATFSGRLVEPDPDSRGPFYRFNLVEKQVYLSAFHLRPETAPAYVEALRRHNVAWLTGYATSYFLLAKLILEQHLKVPPLQAVITTSEKLTTEMREVMEAGYGCPVFEEYSTVETALFASECEVRRLHVSPDVAVVEILREDGSPAEPGETGEVVATCLMRDCQPLIRFRVGDLAQWDPRPCECGRGMPVLKEVVGRLEDLVTGPDGRQMVRFHGVFVDQPRVREGQVIQETLRRIRVRVDVLPGFGPRDVDDIVGRVRQRLGSEVEVVVEPVTQIPRTAAGKFRAVISQLPRNEAAGRAVSG
jgi:phenylacetate-CoA ligase